MRRAKRSKLTAFLIGLGVASASALAAVGGLHVLSPATTDGSAWLWRNSSRQLAHTQALPADVQPALSDTLDVAQTRVAERRADLDPQRALTRSIQQELQRVGCYSGLIDGDWSEPTKSGLSAFIGSLKSRLPVGAPDYIHLTMLQGHRSVACSKSKPDELATTKARIIERPTIRPAPVVRADRIDRGSGATFGTSTLTNGSAPPQVITRQIFEERPQATSEARTSLSRQLANTTSLPPPVINAPAAPLPGRMTVGAPVDEPLPVATPLVPQETAVQPRPTDARLQKHFRRDARPLRETRAPPLYTSNLPSNSGNARGHAAFLKLSRDAP